MAIERKKYSGAGKKIVPKSSREEGRFRGDLLRKLRKDKKFTRKALAARIKGVSLQTITRLELNEVVTNTNTLAKLANALEVPCGYLLGEELQHLQEWALPGELSKRVGKFLDELLAAKSKPSDLLDSMRVFLNTQKPKNVAGLVSEARISIEEEAFGLWLSIINAYNVGRWDMMIAKCRALTNVAEEMGRPYLAAIAHAYMAVAVRNKGEKEAAKKAEEELLNVFKGERFKSALTHRLVAKVYSRGQHLDKALEEFKKAEELMKVSKRNDALSVHETTRLLRGIANTHVKLARSAKQHRDPSSASSHLEQALHYIELCKEAVDTLAKELEKEAIIEKMLLTFCTARYYEVEGEYEKSTKYAKEALKRAEEMDLEYAVRVRMFLCHAYIELGDKEEAVHWCGSLLPLEKYSSGKYEWYYKMYIKSHEKRLSGYLMNQSDFIA